ncbi:MAG: hypothetical protein IJJ29_06090 [Solobacterium sp.]|nr:hypothetical protein [Solobacterium sp.]
MRTTFRSLLTSGKKFAGCYITTACPEMIEVLKYAGLDYVILDLVHDGLTVADLRPMIMAADNVGMAVMVRVEAEDAATIAKVLDLGASALRIPNVDNAEIARTAVRNAYYAPEGIRGVCPNVRGNRYACFGPVDTKKANEELVISAIIESTEGVNNISEILQVEGIDTISVGRSDLANAKGVSGQQDHPLVEEAVLSVAEECTRLGKSCSVTVNNPKNAGKYRDIQGVTHFMVRQPVNILYSAYKEITDTIRRETD